MNLIDTSEASPAWFHPCKAQLWEEGYTPPFWTIPWVQRQDVIPRWVKSRQEPHAWVSGLSASTTLERGGFP